MKKTINLFLISTLLLGVTSCRDDETPVSTPIPTPASTITHTPEITPDNGNVKEEVIQFTMEPWQNVYAEFLREPTNYAENGHFAETFALTDLNNNGIPELIIPFYNDVEGGHIFANVYSYNGNVNIIGRQIDMYYKACWFSTDPLLPGIFVEGGRNMVIIAIFFIIFSGKDISGTSSFRFITFVLPFIFRQVHHFYLSVPQSLSSLLYYYSTATLPFVNGRYDSTQQSARIAAYLC